MRTARISHRFITAGPVDIHQTIQDLIGNGAVQLFQQVMNRRGGTEAIRVDVAPGTLLNLDRTLLQPRRGPVYPSFPRLERTQRPGQDVPQGQSLEPLLTLQRWSEEVKILHADLVLERISKLVNHVTLSMLPDAMLSPVGG